MNTNIIETIIAVSKNRSFQEAAYTLNYTPAVVSKHIARAEEELGIKLFYRGNKANAVTMTPECEAIINELIQIKTQWNRLENTIDFLKNQSRDSGIRIGLSLRTWNYGEDEIIADFIQRNPDIATEITHGYTSDLLDSLAIGKLDCVFVTVSGRAENLEALASFMKNHDCDFYHIMDICRIYLAISSKHPLAQKEEGYLYEFKDFTLAFNSDKKAIFSSSNILPFIELSKKYGMELKYTYLPTTDTSVYKIARSTNIAIPIPDNELKLEGIKYIRLRDWTAPFAYYFVTMNSNQSTALSRLKETVHSYSSRLNLFC